MKTAAQKVPVKVHVKAVAMANASSSHAAPVRAATGIVAAKIVARTVNVQSAAPANGRLLALEATPHVTMDRVQIARQQSPARTAHAPMANVLIARSVQQRLATILAPIQDQAALNIAVRTDHVLNVHTPSAHIAANRTPVIVPTTPASYLGTAVENGLANAKVAASKIGTASARPNS
jgi:hypothetical protein